MEEKGTNDDSLIDFGNGIIVLYIEDNNNEIELKEGNIC